MRIDDFIVVEGRNLAEDQGGEWNKRGLVGVEALTLKLGVFELRIPCAAIAGANKVWPRVEGSELRWEGVHLDGKDYRADPNAYVAAHLYIPGPLSPKSSGFWLTLVLFKVGNGPTDWLIQIKPKAGEPSTERWRRPLLRAWQDKTWGAIGFNEILGSLSERETLATLVDLWSRPNIGSFSQGIDTHPLFDSHDTAFIRPHSNNPPLQFALAAFRDDVGSDVYDVHSHCVLGDEGGGPRGVALAAVTGELATTTVHQPFNLVHAGAADLICAIDNHNRLAEPERFVIEWRGLKGQSTEHGQISFRSLWAIIARHYTLGLTSTRSRNHMSVFPSDVEFPGADEGGEWRCRFRVERSTTPTRPWTLRLMEVTPSSAGTPRLARLVMGATSDAEGSALVRDVPLEAVYWRSLAAAVSNEDRDRDALVRLKKAAVPAPAPLTRVVVGGALIRIQDVHHLSIEVAQLSPLHHFAQAPVEASVSFELQGLSPAAASQDPELGFETVSAWQDRQRPLTIDLLDDQRKVRYEIAESAHRSHSRVLRIGVFADEAGQHKLDAVVVDPEPFFVGRVTLVDGDRYAQGAMIAEYTDDTELPPEWTFPNATGKIACVLPPQARGEEMIKGNLRYPDDRQPRPSPESLFDYRLSPVAQLHIDLSDVDTARVLAPWSTRRIFSHRMGVVGAKLEKARFELLYGITTRIEAKDIRLAETDAFVGRVPFSDDLVRFFQEDLAARATGATTTVLRQRKREYARDVAKQITALFRKPAQLTVFRDFADRTRVTVDTHISFEQRLSRKTADPFALNRLAAQRQLPPGATVPRLEVGIEPLRGGVDFAFESLNIAKEFWGDVISKVGSISGLKFGPLGGSGTQTAVFNNGKTLVITDTTDGRLNSLTLIRIGRIRMLWNHARHVIVYERTTRTAPRYQRMDGKVEDQPADFEGLAALRKVKEYIEITQPTRKFPDTATEKPMAGPLLASSFDSIIIPVKSSWGRDVQDGWVVPLRGPLAPAEERFYPFPKILLQLARASSKGGGKLNQQLSKPQQLAFFTSTNAKDGGDTDLWPPWPGIDHSYSGKPKRAKQQASRPRLGNPVQPDAAPYDLGQANFTVDLFPAEEAVNLMHGRPVEGLEAYLTSICLARGMPDLESLGELGTTAGVAQEMAAAQSVALDGVVEVTERLRELAVARPGAALDGTMRTSMQLVLEEARKHLQQVDLGPLKEGEGKLVPAWTARQKQASADASLGDAAALAPGGNWSQLAVGAILGASEVATADPLDPGKLAEAKKRSHDALEQVCGQIGGRIDAVPSVLEDAFLLLEQLVGESRHKLEALVAEQQDILVAAIEAQRALEQTGAGLSASAKESLRTTLGIVIQAVLRFQDHARQWLQGALNQVFMTVASSNSSAPLPYLTQALERAFEAFQGWMLDLEVALESTDEDLWATLVAMIDSFELPSGVFDAVYEWMATSTENALDGVENARRDARALVTKECGKLHDLLDQIPDAAAFEKFAQDAATKVDTFLRATGGALSSAHKAIEGQLDQLVKTPEWQAIIGQMSSADDYRKATLNELDRIGKELISGRSVEIIAGMVRGIARDFESSLESVAGRIDAVAENEALVAPWREAAKSLEAPHLEAPRILASALLTDTMAASRKLLGYYLDPDSTVIDVTNASALFNRGMGDALNSLSSAMPFDRLRDRMLPQLGNFNVNELFPDFGGLRMEHLLKDLLVPPDFLGEYEWIKMTHGFDRDRLTAWSKVSIDKKFDNSDPPLFTLPPFVLSVKNPTFTAESRLEISKDGAKSQYTRAALKADWTLKLNDRVVLMLKNSTLRYDSGGGFDFDMDMENMVLDESLKFLTDALAALRPNDSGVMITPLLPGGISASLDMPLPDMGSGAFTITGVTLGAHFDLLFVPEFQIRTGLWLSKPSRPFGLAVLFLGGGGWFGVDVSYTPPSKWVTRVSIGISAGAFAALNFGVASGSAGLLFTVGVDFYNEQGSPSGGSSTAISIGILMWGELSIVCVASAYIRLVMRITQRNGEMTGYGMISVSIKICWCFTLNVSSPIQMPFKKEGGGSASAAANAALVDRTSIDAALDAHFAIMDVEV